MPQIDVNEEQVLRALDQLSPTARRLALAKLIPGYDVLDRLVERNRGRIEEAVRPIRRCWPRVGLNAAIDDDVRDMNVARREFAGHALCQTAQRELAHGKRR